jgi:hypothetical protein
MQKWDPSKAARTPRDQKSGSSGIAVRLESSKSPKGSHIWRLKRNQLSFLLYLNQPFGCVQQFKTGWLATDCAPTDAFSLIHSCF